MVEARSLEESGGHYGRSTTGGVQREFIRWRGLVGIVGVRLVLLKVDGWRDMEDTGDS